eukprot:scaffold64677_cov30-Tisochrysis_lutea.AAC.5
MVRTSGTAYIPRAHRQAAVAARRIQNASLRHTALAGPHECASHDRPSSLLGRILAQAQVMVAIETAARKNARLNLPPEQILWAGTPYLRTRTVVLLFLLWSILLVLPVVFLVELVDDIGDTGIDGGWLSLAWAVVSVFIFVPRVRLNLGKRGFLLMSFLSHSGDAACLQRPDVAAASTRCPACCSIGDASKPGGLCTHKSSSVPIAAHNVVLHRDGAAES